jgi:hypothetical protein
MSLVEDLVDLMPNFEALRCKILSMECILLSVRAYSKTRSRSSLGKRAKRGLRVCVLINSFSMFHANGSTQRP